MSSKWNKFKHNLKKRLHFLWLLGRLIWRSIHKIRITRNLVLLVASISIIFASLIILWLASLRIPDFTSFDDRKIINSTKIFDRTGEVLLYDIHQDIRRTNITFEEMGKNIKNATVAIEDSDFYNHNGIRVSSVARAVLSNVLPGGRTQGGSTITQQLVKNTLLTSEKTLRKKIGRKIKEWVLAVKVDSAFSKEKILELYLNEIPYGGTVYGIAEAARNYFNKKAADLTLGEAAYLAAIPQSPTYLSPYGKNKDKLEERKNLVLRRMRELGFISEADYNTAREEVVTFVPQTIGNIKAPHFVFFIKEYLEQKYGTEMVENGGLQVITTLDYKLQEVGEKIVKEGALANEKNWNGKNAGLVAVDPKTGQIITMVGSRDYFDKAIDGNYNIATARRQPGSSFKPFVYATAFAKGFTPETVLFDLPTEFQASCDPLGIAIPGRGRQSDCYKPNNYDGKFRGPMTLRDALSQSINIPAVKLLYLTTTKDSLKTAEDMGISTLEDPSRYGLTLVIGGGEVTLLDMVSAYGVFANEGVRNQSTGILKVTDGNGTVLEEFSPKERPVLPPNVALTISDILSKEETRIPTFGAHSPLYVPGFEVAAKTGTTNNNKDAWILGYTPSLAAGVWAGNNDNTPMKKGGAAMAGPIWNKFMQEALKVMPKEGFEKPDLSIDPSLKPALRGFWQGSETFLVDKISGKAATPDTPPETIEERVVTNVHTILYWVDRNNILGPSPGNPQSNPQFRNWETPIQNWWAQNKNNYPVTSWRDMPEDEDDVHDDDSKPSVEILEPNENKIYDAGEKIQLRIKSDGRFPLQKMEIYINNVYLGEVERPFSFSFRPSELDELNDVNDLRIIFYDTAYNKGVVTTTFRVNQ